PRARGAKLLRRRLSRSLSRAGGSAAVAHIWYCSETPRLTLRYATQMQRPDVCAGSRAIRGGTPMDRLLTDVRFALRALMKRPMTTAALVATLALGIGANAAVFGVVDALVLHPYD